MNEKVTVLILYAMLLALSLPAEAQQAGKVPRIGYVSPTGAVPRLPGLRSRDSSKDCEISVISRGKTLSSSIAMSRESSIVTQAL